MLLYFPQFFVDFYLNVLGYLSMFLGRALVGPRNLQVSLPAGCNHNCPFCITDIHGTGGLKGKDPLTFDELKSIVVQALDSRTMRFNLVSNGEPLMYPHIRELIEFIGEQSRYKARIKIITNGTLLSNFSYEFMYRHNVEIWLSLHSFDFDVWQQTHRPLYRNSKEVFSSMVEYLLDYPCNVTLHCVISSINENKLSSIVDLSRKLRKVKVNFSIVKKFDDLLPRKLDQANLEKILAELQEIKISNNLKSIIDNHLSFFVEQDDEKIDDDSFLDFFHKKNCYANYIMSFIDEQGMFYFCGANSGLGSIKKNSFKNLYFEKAKQLRLEAHRIGDTQQKVKGCHCESCPHLDINEHANRVLP